MNIARLCRHNTWLGWQFGFISLFHLAPREGLIGVPRAPQILFLPPSSPALDLEEGIELRNIHLQCFQILTVVLSSDHALFQSRVLYNELFHG